MTTVQIPHKFNPRPYQLPFLKALDRGIKRFVLVWHRRAGKDKTVMNGLVKKMLERVGTYYYFLPTYNQAKKVVWNGIDKDGLKFLDHIPAELIVKKNETEMRIEIANGSVLQIVGAENIDTIVGTNPIGVIFSEYSLMKSQAWDFIRPVLAENGGWAIFVFTPRGMNLGWKILQVAQNNPLTWFSQVLTVDDTKAISREDIEAEIQAGMPQDLVDQEFYCKFLDGATNVFKRIEANVHNEVIMPEEGKFYQIGIDLAKYQDFTVITPIDRHTFHVANQERFNTMDWADQKLAIRRSLLAWNNAVAYVDATGVGDPIVEDLQRSRLQVEAFKFTETSRKDLLNHLKAMLEQGKIKIPNDQGLIDELKSMQYELVGEKLKMKVPDGLHDDRIMSLALAVWELHDTMPVRQPQALTSPKLQSYR